ncbi:MAG TPA: DUF2281 domain-containing protein [Tepidisphaeraceae bacterium]|jgi:hypothetical protein
MAPRLEEALKGLPAAKVEEVAQFAERLAASYRHQQSQNQFLKISWAGAAKSLRKEYASGVDMAHDALQLRSRENHS